MQSDEDIPAFGEIGQMPEPQIDGAHAAGVPGGGEQHSRLGGIEGQPSGENLQMVLSDAAVESGVQPGKSHCLAHFNADSSGRFQICLTAKEIKAEAVIVFRFGHPLEMVGTVAHADGKDFIRGESVQRVAAHDQHFWEAEEAFTGQAGLLELAGDLVVRADVCDWREMLCHRFKTKQINLFRAVESERGLAVSPAGMFPGGSVDGPVK